MKIKEKIEVIIKILIDNLRPYWYDSGNSYNLGFNEGINKAIKLLKEEKWN